MIPGGSFSRFKLQFSRFEPYLGDLICYGVGEGENKGVKETEKGVGELEMAEKRSFPGDLLGAFSPLLGTREYFQTFS